MSNHRRFLNRMTLFVLAVAAVAAALAGPLSRAFMANPALNGVIAAVLLAGIAFSFRQVLMLRPEAEWVRAYRREGATPPAQTPRLLGPVAAMLGERDDGRPVRMTALSMRSLLDGVASRLEEGREISRYMTRLLIFLGLLGTFWGLLAVLAAIGDTIQSLSAESEDIVVMFDRLKSGLEKPLDGMAIAFSSSLFGLAGSVVLGFLDLQTGQAQNRFFNDLEDWLSGEARVTASGPTLGGGDEDTGGASANAYLSALLEQTADSLDGLRRSIEASESRRAETDAALTRLSEALAGLSDQMQADRGAAKKLTDAQLATQSSLDKLTGQIGSQEAGLDEASRAHLRNMDVNIKRLIEGQDKASHATVEGLRGEIKLLARTVATALEGRSGGSRDSRGSGRGSES